MQLYLIFIRMLTGKRFRLKTETLGINTVDGKRVAVPVPTGAIIEITRDGSRPGGMVDVRWDGKALTMFFEDIQNRGEAVTKKRGEARSNHLRAASPAFLPRSLK